jgi:hypothetical protein
MRFQKSLMVAFLGSGFFLATAGVGKADVWCNENLKPPQGFSAGDLDKSIGVPVDVQRYKLGGFTIFGSLLEGGGTQLVWSGGRVSGSRPPQWYCYQITGDEQIYGQVTWTHLQPEGGAPQSGDKSGTAPGVPPLDMIPALSFRYDFATDGVTDDYLVTFAHTASPFPLHLVELKVGFVPAPVDIDDVNDDGFDAAGVTWVYEDADDVLAPGDILQFDVPMPAGSAVVYRVELSFVNQNPLVSPSLQAGQGFEQ